MKKLLPICFILLFSFCSKRESKYPRITVPERKNPIEVNTKTMLHRSTDNQEEFFLANFDRDTIINEDPEKDEKNFKMFERDKIFERYNLKLVIDTSYTISARGFEYRNLDLTPDGFMDFAKVFALQKEYVVCYPLLIYNNDNKPMCSGEYIRLIQEAKDTDGKWKPIEFFSNVPSCIPLIYFYEFFPKKYSSMSIIKYHGDFKTKLRVKMRIGESTYYSNEIDGKINRTQFDKETARKILKFYGHLSIRPVSEERLQYCLLKKNKP